MRLALLLLASLLAGVSAQDWVARYSSGAQSSDEALALAVDPYGYSYVAGYAQGIAVVKYGPNGESLWSRTRDGINRRACGQMAAAFDPNGNLVVATAIYPNPLNGFRLIRYTPLGQLSLDTVFWHSSSAVQPSNVPPVNVAIASSGRIYVSGTSWSDSAGTLKDIVTCCFDPTGGVRWVKYFDGQRHDDDRATALALDRNAHLVVAGYVQDASHHDDAVVLEYDTAGTLLWSYVHRPNTNFQSKAYDVAVTTSGEIYVSGWLAGSGLPDQCLVVKLGPNGDSLWSRTDSTEDATLVIDGSNNVYATGFRRRSFPAASTMRTWKYSPTGQRLWRDDYEDSITNGTYGRKAVLASDQGVYSVGYRGMSASKTDFFVVRYRPDGSRTWVAIADTTDSFTDIPKTAALGANGDIIVTGTSTNSQTSYTDFLTMKFRASGAVEGPAEKGPIAAKALTVLPTVVARRCRFALPARARATGLRILDAAGRTVREIPIPAGENAAVWDATDEAGRPVPNGVYFVTLEGAGSRSAAKFIIQR
jgi:uncharacterized delta-60 repeat protein